MTTPLPFESLTEGMSASLSRTVTETDVVLFAGISGDTNPVHLDDVVARASHFGGRIAHGMLTAGLVSAVLGTRLPGPGSVYLSQTLRFRRPVRIGDTVTATARITHIDREKRRITLETICANHEGDDVLTGEALVWVPGGE